MEVGFTEQKFWPAKSENPGLDRDEERISRSSFRFINCRVFIFIIRF